MSYEATMITLRERILKAVAGEPILAIVFTFDADWVPEAVKRNYGWDISQIAPNRLYSWAEIEGNLDQPINVEKSYALASVPFTLWTETRVLFVMEYDSMGSIEARPLKPTADIEPIVGRWLDQEGDL